MPASCAQFIELFDPTRVRFDPDFAPRWPGLDVDEMRLVVSLERFRAEEEAAAAVVVATGTEHPRRVAASAAAIEAESSAEGMPEAKEAARSLAESR